MIFRRIVQSSSIADSRKKRVYWLTAGVSVAYGLIFLSIWPGAFSNIFGFGLSRNMVAFGLFVTFVVRYTHYYMDAVVFKMSDPVTRAAVSPLLVPMNAQSAIETARGDMDRKKVTKPVRVPAETA